MTTSIRNPFEEISLDWLRQRKSEKWATYPADVLPAFVAEMDFPLADSVSASLQAAIASGDCGYASARELPAVFTEFAARRFQWNVDRRAVFVLPDVMAGVSESIRTLTEPGAKVVINPPVYPPFFEVINTTGRTICAVPLRQDEAGRFAMDWQQLEEAFAGGAQAFVLCSPHNPVGRAWSHDELERMSSLAKRFAVAVISDEIHAPLTMPGVTHIPFSLVADQDQPCVVVTSASKAWNIAGLKCAVMVAGESVRKKIEDRITSIPTEIESRVGHLGVLASVAAFADGCQWLDQLRVHLDGNRKLLAELLKEHLPLARYVPPEATYLAWVDLSAFNLSDNPAKHILKRGRVALHPGYKFGKPGANFVRVNMGTSQAILTEIVRRIASAF